jgi:hypothetical protein
MNYPEETMPPLADYGGGSGCGGMYVYEPRWPADFNNAAYTCDWGTSEVYVHRLVNDQATFKPHQASFLKIARPTDVDMDTSGRMYVASWLNGGFSFSDKNVGFVAMVTPRDFLPKPFPFLTSQTSAQLVELLARSGAAGTFHVSRELIRRGEQPDVAKLLLETAANSSVGTANRTWHPRSHHSTRRFKSGYGSLGSDRSVQRRFRSDIHRRQRCHRCGTGCQFLATLRPGTESTFERATSRDFNNAIVTSSLQC